MRSHDLTPRLFAAALLLSLHSLAFSQTCTNLCLKQQTCAGGATTSLSGYVFDPANNLPVPNAIVYVPNGAVQPFVDGPGGGSQITGSPLVSTTTNIAGHFTLNNMPVGSNIPVVVQAGLWRRQFTIPTINSCTANILPGGSAANSGNLTLPANHTQGDIPKIAVVTGGDSSVECVALKIGVSQSEFTDPGGSGRINLYEGDGLGGGVVSGSSPAESTLFSSQANLNAYDVVLFGSQGQTDPDATTANQLELANFANAGGRVFAETMGYGWLDGNSSFSGTVNWNPGQGTWGNYLSDPTYPSNIDTTFTRGTELGQWLNQAIVYGGTLDQFPVGVIRNDFTSVDSGVHRWLYTANDVNVGGNGQGPGPNIPLQFTFDTPVGSSSQPGRVWFNDYLVDAEQNSSGYQGIPFPAECPTGGMTPQEKLFEYGLFDLTTSLGPPTATVTVTNSPSTFTQGDSSDILTIDIADTSASALDSSLTLTAALPTGLTAVSMAGQNSGTAWACNSSTLVCTRSASLGLAASDPITLAVAVAANAPTGSGALTVSATATDGGLASSVNGGDAVTIAAGGCSTDAACSAGSWCNESLRACVSTLANNVPIPTDPSHSNPTLNGICSTFAATLVCTSGVCDGNGNKCGYSNGDGVCTQVNAAAVCDSGACSVSNVCMPAGGCEVNADCGSGAQCNAAKACIPSLSISGWPTASPINQGQALSASTLTGGAASVSGTFGWTSPATVPPVGTSSQSVTFSPVDLTDYTAVSGDVSILVNGPATNLVVTTAADDTGNAGNCTLQATAGSGSDPSCTLRDALLFASTAGSRKISFDGTAFSGSNSPATNTITLNKGTLNIPSNTAITFGPGTIVLATGDGPPIGSLGEAIDNVTFSTAVGESHSLEIEGWVADPQDGAPLSNVTVYIDGTSVGAPTLGLARPSVAAIYNNNAYLNSGYLLLYPVLSLVLGTHHVTVVAIDSGGRSTTFGPRTFTIAPTAGLGSPFGGIDGAVDSTTSTTTVSQADSLLVHGWVVDPQDGAPVSNVKVYVDGTVIGTPTLGFSRTDIAKAYGNNYLHSGFRLLYPASSLTTGTHQVTVVATDSGGRSTTIGPRTITVQ